MGRYRFVETWVQEVTSRRSAAQSEKPKFIRALACVAADDDYLREVVYPTPEIYKKEVSDHYKGQLWGWTDILPLVDYSKRVEAAAASMGQDALDNYLDETLLADGKTTL